MSKIQILSDLHLEFELQEFDFTSCEVLVLAGDIHVGTKGVEWIMSKVNDIPVIYVLGNHEYYNNCYPDLVNECKEIAKGSNIHVLENESITIEEVTFHCATLWTDFQLYGKTEASKLECELRMNDYRLIRIDQEGSILTADYSQRLQQETISWLKKSLSQSTTEKNIVITHHAPSIRSVASRYKESILTTGFASNLEDIIIKYQPDLWIHGHVHDVADYSIGKTRVLCNPRGYPHEKSNGFNSQFFVDI